MALDARGMPLRVLTTKGNTAQGTQAEDPIDGLRDQYLLADRGYDSDEIVDQACA